MIGLLDCVCSYGQKDTLNFVTINLIKATPKEFIKLLENQTTVHFYYDAEKLDTLTITLSAKKYPVKTLLDAAFAKTGFYHAIGDDGHVFIT